MNSSQSPANPKLKILVPLIAALAASLVLSLLVTGAASAGQGGVTLGGDDSVAGKQTNGNRGHSAKENRKYKRLWRKVSRRNKRWANRTAKCESGRNPRAIGGGGSYRGAFQFLKSTWRGAPKSPGGDPIVYPYRTQAVVAVALKRREGAGHLAELRLTGRPLLAGIHLEPRDAAGLSASRGGSAPRPRRGGG